MGRKIKPRHLKREHVSISLPLDVVMYLDKYTVRTGGTRSRFIESLVRASMLKGQATLDIQRHLWHCPKCDSQFHVNKKTPMIKCSCGFYLEEELHYQGILNLEEEE